MKSIGLFSGWVLSWSWSRRGVWLGRLTGFDGPFEVWKGVSVKWSPGFGYQLNRTWWNKGKDEGITEEIDDIQY